MIFSRDDILKDLRKTVMEVHFTKVNGENRIMHCSLMPELLPETYANDITEEKDFHQKNDGVIAAWDIQNRGWRSFRVDSVMYLQDITHKYF
jgi:hypothetical protein